MTELERDNLLISIANGVKSLSNKVTSLETRMDSLEKAVATLEIRMDSLEKAVASLENRMTSLENTVTVMQFEMKDNFGILFDAFESHNDKFFNHNNEIIKLKKDVNLNSNKIDSLELKISNL